MDSFNSLVTPRSTLWLKWSAAVGLVAAGLIVVSGVFAHGEEIAVGGGVKGPVHLTAAQENALGLKVESADLRPISETLNLNGEVRPVAGRQAEVSTRISGQVSQVSATLGQTVRAGQPLARVQSRLVGDPPPSVTVTAPMSGVIDEVTANVGQSVEPSTILFRIRNSVEVNLVARVYEEDLGKVQVGQNTHVRLLSYPDRLLTGKISLIGPVLDPLSRTVEVWVTLANTDSLLKPNMFARVGVLLREEDATLTVPNQAIIEANGEKFVFVKQKDEYARVEITTGTSDDNYTEVTDGLVPGDEVVTQGNRQVYTAWLTGGAPLRGEDD